MFITGKGAFVQATSQVLSLFGITCNRSGFSDSLEDEFDEQISEGICDSDVVLAIGNDSAGANQHVGLIHRLRSRLAFEGTYLAILNSDERAERFKHCSLTGDSKWRFENIPGHAVLSQPVLLAQLLSKMAEVEPLYSEQWFGLLDQCVVGKIPGMVEKADRLIQQGDPDKAKDVLKKVITEMDSVDWLPLLHDPHQGMKEVSRFFEQYRDSDLTRDDSREVLGRVRMFLDATVIGGGNVGE